MQVSPWTSSYNAQYRNHDEIISPNAGQNEEASAEQIMGQAVTDSEQCCISAA